MTGIEGFDPLAAFGDEGKESFLDDANRRIIQNILKSYTGYFDVFNELAQNSLDALEAKLRAGEKDFDPKIWVSIDMKSGRIKVVDNGIGMTEEEFKFFLRPNVSFKTQREARGHKGVGASFLAYGFSNIKIQTRKNGSELSAFLRQGRAWAEDTKGFIPKPKFEEVEFKVAELDSVETGTSVEIVLGNEAGVRPRDLGWLGAHTADAWSEVLRIKTPIGGVYLETSSFSPTVFVKVTDLEGRSTNTKLEKPDYFYPHDLSKFEGCDHHRNSRSAFQPKK